MVKIRIIIVNKWKSKETEQMFGKVKILDEQMFGNLDK
jgi:hypothetical protein